MMERVIRDMDDKIDDLVEQLGCLPEAPLAMPKQRIETSDPATAWFGRLIGRGGVPVGDAGRSGR